MSYATLAQIKEYLGIATAETSDDALLAWFLTAAQQQIDSHTGRAFEASSDTTRRYDAVRHVSGLTLWLDGDDLAQITSVVNGDGATITSSQYVTEPRAETPYHSIRLKASSGITWVYTDDPEDAIAITGRYAYSVTASADIQRACRRLVGYLYRQKDAQIFDVTAQPDLGQIVIPQGIPKDVQLILDPYRRRV